MFDQLESDWERRNTLALSSKVSLTQEIHYKGIDIIKRQ